MSQQSITVWHLWNHLSKHVHDIQHVVTFYLCVCVCMCVPCSTVCVYCVFMHSIMNWEVCIYLNTEINVEDAETLNAGEKKTVNIDEETGKIQIGDDKVEKDEPGRQEDEESSDDSGDADFPDTAIELRHVTGTR